MKAITSKEKGSSTFSNLGYQSVVEDYCKCGEMFPKEYKMFIPGIVEPVLMKRTMCFNCEKTEEDRLIISEIEKERAEAKMKRMRRIFDENSLMNPKLKNASFDNYEPTSPELSKAKSLAMRYADNFSKDNPVSLLFIGNYGTGKSHLSVAVTKELMNKDFTCIFISTPKLMTKIRSTYNKDSEYSEEQIIETLSEVDCLVLDDIGAEATKQGDNNQHTWATSKIFEIIDNRIGKHTIFTSNYSPEELQQRLGGRNFSRMMEDTHVIKMHGDDYRLRKFK